jgi:Holliday junction resolvasome RuvABC endonuclease subunit
MGSLVMAIHDLQHMMVRVLGVDGSMSNFGLASAWLKRADLSIKVDGLRLIETERRVNKIVRQNSDDLRRARELHKDFTLEARQYAIAFAEVPTGAQSARAMYSNGITVAILASCPIPLIEVQPTETKIATVGTKTASKEEMIEWAVEKYPDAPWIRHNGKIVKKNEHLADAIAVIHAGIRTDVFQQLLAMMPATPSLVPA